LGSHIARQFDHQPADAVVVFASAQYDHSTLLGAIKAACRPGVMVGCSSSGEFTSAQVGQGSACVLAFRSPDMRFSASVGTGLGADRAAAAQQMVAGFSGLDSNEFQHRSALVLADALAGYTDDLVEELSLATAGTYQMFGGGAGDDAQFASTQVFCGTQAFSDAAVALEILSNKPIGIGFSHGWVPLSAPMRVTEAHETRLVSLNAMPAAEAFEEHADATGQKFNREDPLPFFLHNVIGIETGHGFKLRVPLAVGEDGSISCAADIPVGATICIMGTSDHSAAEAATRAVEVALKQIEGSKPRVALFFDCVATRLRIGKEFGMEMQALQTALGDTQYIGCNTHGQIARTDGQFNGFHNCTATVCVIGE
jgi:hypothetical protein